MGELRWRAPQPPRKWWGRRKPYDATYFKAECMQGKLHNPGTFLRAIYRCEMSLIPFVVAMCVNDRSTRDHERGLVSEMHVSYSYYSLGKLWGFSDSPCERAIRSAPVVSACS